MFYPYNLTLHRYKLVFALPEKLTISNYTGSKIRGMIGAALKEYQAPIYQQLYEHALDKPNPMLNAKGDDMPAPYMITPLPYNKGQRTTEVILTLFGHFSDYFSAIVDALDKAVKDDTLSNEIFKLIHHEELICPYTKQSSFSYIEIAHVIQRNIRRNASTNKKVPLLKFHFITSFLIEDKKQLITDFRFFNIVRALHRRVALLSALYGNVNAKIEEIQESSELHNIQVVKVDLNRIRIIRDPSDKNQYTKYGWRGSLSYTGNDIEALLPLLHFGQYTQIGQDTAFGHGAYHLDFYTNEKE